MLVNSLNRRMAQKELSVELTDKAREFVLENGYDPLYGARPLRRYLQHTVENLISRRIIAGNVSAGDVLTVDVENGELTVL